MLRLRVCEEGSGGGRQFFEVIWRGLSNRAVDFYWTGKLCWQHICAHNDSGLASEVIALARGGGGASSWKEG